ncbi:MAG: translocation/assembly module TamB domain-containing protein [Candidatus Omnitrophota bacterium]
MRKNTINRIAIVTVIITMVIGSCIFFYWLLFTRQGAVCGAEYLINMYFGKGNITAAAIEGELSSKVVFRDLEMSGFGFLPDKSRINIQKVEIHSLLPQITVEIYNGKMILPYSDPIGFYGSIKKGMLEIEVYSNKLGVDDIISFLPVNIFLTGLKGDIGDITCFISGTVNNPVFAGEFTIRRITRQKFSVSESPVIFNIGVESYGDPIKIKGEIVIRGGKITGPRTVVDLRHSMIAFSGAPDSMMMDINGTSTIGGYRIRIEVEGSAGNPQMRLSSAPYLPQERILLILATGKTWESVERSVSEGRISGDIVKDFLDYFIFSGSGDKLAGRLGVDKVDFKYTGGAAGIEIKKNLDGKTEAKYGYEQQVNAGLPAGSGKHIIGGEYNVTDNISVEGEKNSQDPKGLINTTAETEDKVVVKYKKNF